MLSWTIQITIISIILIFLIHHLLNFFKSALTVPKIKDLVNMPNKKYENIFNVINNSSSLKDYTTLSELDENTNYKLNIDKLLPKKEINMKNELKNFIKKQLKNEQNIQPSIGVSYLDTSNTNSNQNFSYI
jgi:hypothetical protein